MYDTYITLSTTNLTLFFTAKLFKNALTVDNISAQFWQLKNLQTKKQLEKKTCLLLIKKKYFIIILFEKAVKKPKSKLCSIKIIT